MGAHPPQQTLRILTYNMRKGKGDHLSRKDQTTLTQARAEIMAQAAPDLIFLQEAFHPHDGQAGQADGLADQLGMYLAYTPNNSLAQGHYGNAILSRFPITVWVNYNISTNRLEHRGALYARVAWHGQNLHLINTHLGLNKRQRLTQVTHLRGVLDSHVPAQQPVIVAGDFNDWTGRLQAPIRRHLPLHDALAHLHPRDRRTWHTRLPVFALDRMYYSGLLPLEVQVMRNSAWQELSDHFPVQASFRALPVSANLPLAM